MIQTGILLVLTLIWARIQPEVSYGISQGYGTGELEKLKSSSLRQIVFYFGFENGLLIILLYVLKGLVFIIALERYMQAELWQQWLCLGLLIALHGTPTGSNSSAFWKRWSTYMGGIMPLYPELAQLSLATLVALSLLSRQKKHIVWSNTVAAFGLVWLDHLPYPIMGFMLATCWLTSAGLSPKRLTPLVNTAIKAMLSPKHSFD